MICGIALIYAKVWGAFIQGMTMADNPYAASYFYKEWATDSGKQRSGHLN
jgi:hypothetical protein